MMPSCAPLWLLLTLLLSHRNVSGYGYCSWSGCDGNKQGGDFCNKSEHKCTVGCDGTWCIDSDTNRAAGGTNRAIVLSDRQFYSGTNEAPRPAPQPQPAPAISNSGKKLATTTRYWDCSGGSCGCSYLPFGDTKKPAHCHSNAMFTAPRGNRYGATFYGTAAVSQALGGGGWLSEGCGKCWKVTGTSTITSQTTTLVLKAANFCPPDNEVCSGGKVHFDIAAPGFDVLKYSLSNTCSQREANEAQGFRACSGWMINDRNPFGNCNCSLFKDRTLRLGCENFYSLKWDNVQVEYEEVSCPSELSQLSCWEQNGNGYPDGVPALCASN